MLLFCFGLTGFGFGSVAGLVFVVGSTYFVKLAKRKSNGVEFAMNSCTELVGSSKKMTAFEVEAAGVNIDTFFFGSLYHFRIREKFYGQIHIFFQTFPQTDIISS